MSRTFKKKKNSALPQFTQDNAIKRDTVGQLYTTIKIYGSVAHLTALAHQSMFIGRCEEKKDVWGSYHEATIRSQI